MKIITIITPVYNEEENLPLYFDAVKEFFFSNAGYNFQIILVDDGSIDDSWNIIQSFAAEQPQRVLGIRLSRNHGAHQALAAGFSFAEGDAVSVLAADLQDPPETVLAFIKSWEEGNDVVWGVRNKRDDSSWKIFTSSLFEKLLRKWAMPKSSKFSTGSFLLMDKKVVQYYNRFREQNRITFALVGYMGFEQAQVLYDRQSRKKGVSGWTFSKMIKALYDALIGFSYMPIRITTIISLIALLAVIPVGAFVIYLYLAGRSDNIGWVSNILVEIFFGSLILLNLSFILEYLMRVYLNSAQRPLFFISETTKDHS